MKWKNIISYRVKLFSIISILSLLCLSGCGTSTLTGTINFDDYQIPLYTTQHYNSSPTDIQKLENPIKKHIIDIYTAGEKNSFNDSIIITKNSQTYKDIEDFVAKTREYISYDLYTEKKNTDITMKECTPALDGIVMSSYIDNDKYQRYFVQGFFLNKYFAYLISASTDDKDEFDLLYKSFKNIDCKKIEK